MGVVIGVAFVALVAGYAIWRNMSDGIGNNRTSTGANAASAASAATTTATTT